MIDFIVGLIVLLKVPHLSAHLALKYDTFHFFIQTHVTTFLSTTQQATNGVKRRGHWPADTYWP